jgi:urease accessory protein
MITVGSVVGNKNKDENLLQIYQNMVRKDLVDIVQMSRMEAQRVRMRKSSNKGTDIAITLPQNVQIKHGDVLLLNSERMIVVEITPERVAVVALTENTPNDHVFEIAVKIGHTIGNLHRPIKLEDNKVVLPIQADSELDLLVKLFSSMKEHVSITSSTMVFEPEEGAHIHEH